jgi:hypothetical protein
MIQVICRYKKGVFNRVQCLHGTSPESVVGKEVQKLVAEAANTKQYSLKPESIDWIPQQYEEGSITRSDVFLEIRINGYLERKEKINKQVLQKLRLDILSVPGFPKVPEFVPIIRLQFVDPDGLHV